MEEVGVFDGNLVYFTDIWYIFWPICIFCGQFVYFMVIWYIFSRFGLLSQEKSGDPAMHLL
jgi:hypothetical protein